ncbi:telomere length regulation protein-domain-containing protein [Dactylonectria estremocensis]|uniref:Telomere length regulation protein-domain-containing protein n=1 Tax=Dactylonectria estremocensis TaxID=1079267 RepID=A0A9P9FL24_9HYPO|nr:telomere length regulation protein-domain-containing protein [Dactylonectria estremocensis]
MDELFTPVSTTYLKPRNEPELLLTKVKSTVSTQTTNEHRTVSSADDVLDILKNQPDYDTLIAVLKFLNSPGRTSDRFQFHVPGPKSAGIVNLLVSEIASNYWTLLLEGSNDDDARSGGITSPDAELFLNCLRSVTGLNATIAQIKALTQESRAGGKESKRSDVSLSLNILLDLLAAVLDGDDSVHDIWAASTEGIPSASMKKAQSQKLGSLLSNGQMTSVSAEALSIIGTAGVRRETQWIANGVEYSKWVGRNIVALAKRQDNGEELSFCSDLFQRSLSLSYSETVLKGVIDGLLLAQGSTSSTFIKVVFSQPRNSKKILNILLSYLSEKFLAHLSLEEVSQNETVSAVAAIIQAVADDDGRKKLLIDWCASPSGAGLGVGIGIRRSVLAALAQDKEAITTVLTKSLAQFGDELYIKHAAMLQQNVHTEILLLAAGYVYRISPIKLIMLLRTGSYLSTISNRIGATQIRARFLGMIVGESLSALIDNKEKKLDFHMEETDTDEAKQLKNLVKVSDNPGPVDLILPETQAQSISQHRKPIATVSKPIPRKMKPKPKPAMPTPKPKAIIQEIDSSDDEDEDELTPYAKDTDPEDSDDDATLVQRNKVKAPVYIRDLITYLRDSESYDKQKLAIQEAPVLIRRKANYGTEVSSHADELAGLFVGLQDKFEIDDFDNLRLQGMISLVVSQPKAMAPWFARTFFEGDYSLSQRTAVLITLGLSARELAGFEVSQHQPAAIFPSKRLPEKMEQLYIQSSKQNTVQNPQLKALPPNAIDTITQSLTSSFLAPLAAEAADANTGPDVLKLQSFTARYKSTTKAKPRARAIPNTTAALLATTFFSPLTAHFQVALRSSKPLILNPALLALYLQTLGIVIHAAGPSTLSLPQLTSELWDLLLGVRVHVLGDVGALKGWLVAMASLLKVNGDDMQRLCQSQGREVMETREWVAVVFERTRGEDGGEENEVKMLAAGVLIRIGEAIEKYQALLMGTMIGFT